MKRPIYIEGFGWRTQWIDVSKRIFNHTNGLRKMRYTVGGFTREGTPFSVICETRAEAERIQKAMYITETKGVTNE